VKPEERWASDRSDGVSFKHNEFEFQMVMALGAT
jgi:hypothetical protein